MAQPYAPMLQQMMLEFQNQRLESAERIARSILRVNSRDLMALQVQGLCMAMQNRLAESVEIFEKASKLDPKNPEILANLAKSQHSANLFLDATKTYEKLNRLVPNNFQILTDTATAYAKLHDFEKALSLYTQSIKLQPDYFLTWSNLGNLYAAVKLLPKALESYEKSLSLNPKYPEAWTNLGNALFDIGRYQDSIAAHQKAIEIDPQYAEAWANLGNGLLEVKRDDEAFECYKKAYSIKPLHPYLMGQLLAAKQNSAIWDDDPSVANMLDLVAANESVAMPFILLNTPASLELQKKCAIQYVRNKYATDKSKTSVVKPKSTNSRLNIAYFSSDFKFHPVGVLMKNIIKMHDRSRFQVSGVFLNRETGDEVEEQFKTLFDHSYHIHNLGDQEVYDLLNRLDIDIAIDLNCHTTGARTALFANRIAPIQINYLGFAGTSGADFYDCLIADQVVIPPNDRPYYTEFVSYLPNSFFPADTSISIASLGPLPKREDHGLPDNSFVFACFNNLYKITPTVFDSWIKLLKSLPNSVLWLSKFSDIASSNLIKEAEKRGVDSSRLIFAERVPSRAGYLSRLRLADLFLDTPNYNAHTTAADALWAGLPVLTQIGNTFAGRVAASQLTALGLPELITNSEDEYVARALELANNPQLLGNLRERLEVNRMSAPLFDTNQYVADLESLYQNLINEKAAAN